MNLFVKRIGAHEAIPHFVNAINGVLGLKPRELDFFREVLIVLMEDVSTGADVYDTKYQVLNQKNRAIISHRMDIEEASINRYIMKFKDKDILQVGEDKILRLRDEVMPVIINNRIQVTILLNLDAKLNSPFANQ